MTKDELKKKLKTEIADWWRIKFRVEQKDDICQTISGKETSELCLIIAEPREKRIAELEAKIKHLTKHLEPQVMSALFEQVEEEVKQEQRIKELEAQVKYWKSEYDKLFNED